jgi:hypothetical protein
LDYRPNSAARSYQTSFAATLALYSCPLARTALPATLSSGRTALGNLLPSAHGPRMVEDTPQRPDLRMDLFL